MEALVHFASSLAPTAAGSLLSAAWEGAVLATCVLLCLRLLPRLSAAARSVVWLNVFLLLVLLHLVPCFTARGAGTIPSHSAPLELSWQWSYLIAGAWILLSALRGIQLISSAWRLRGLAMRATPVNPGPALRGLLQTGEAGSKRARVAELCTSTEVARPSVLGFFHPRILLPPALLERLTSEELEQVVLHEMEHLRRGDDWTNLLQKLALVLFPLNPALFWVERRLCAERELACDDRVMNSSRGRKAYALCLTHLAEYSLLQRSLSLALGAWERQSELVRRVHRILRRPAKSLSARQTWALAGGVTMAGLFCALALARLPQLVAFTPTAPQLAQSNLFPSPGFSAANRGEFGLHAQMVKAVLPERQSAGVAASELAAAPGATHKKVLTRATRPHMAQPQQAWVVMTEWNDFDAAPHLVLTVSQTGRSAGKQLRANRVSYAAVPFANGWLIVRI